MAVVTRADIIAALGPLDDIATEFDIEMENAAADDGKR
jgi:hypothetical protein